MKVVTGIYKDAQIEWDADGMSQLTPEDVQLVLVFGDRMAIGQPQLLTALQSTFTKAPIVLCSTSGEIYNHHIIDGGALVVLWSMEHTTIRVVQANQADYPSDFELGQSLAKALPEAALNWVFALSDGSVVNGSSWVEGLNAALAPEVVLSGGLAGDGLRFEATAVGLNELPKMGNTVAIGFYGAHLKVQTVALGGFQSFGRKRCITHASNNIVYQIDHQPAVDVYKTYLGKYADEMPGAALQFPLALYQTDSEDSPLVRTILSMNTSDGSMVFAGNMPEGGWVRLMHAQADELILAAEAAAMGLTAHNTTPFDLVFVVSCVGRKIVLGPRCIEEIEAAQHIFKSPIPMIGFYSHGEVAPLLQQQRATLLNQTFTLTGVSEVPYGHS